jgi:hypothetical protein
MPVSKAAPAEEMRIFPEDLEHNYRRVTEISPARCNGCARYHINWPLARLVNLVSPYGSDRSVFAETIDRLVEEVASNPGPARITIVGTADTGVPALAMRSAFATGLISRLELLVIDQCDTPLQLCRDFAELHQVPIRTVQADVTAPSDDVPSDIVVVHSLLRFIAADSRVECLRRWKKWLKPGGRLLVSNTFAPTTGRDTHSPFTEGLRALVERDEIELAEPKERFLSRLDQAPPWPISTLTEQELLDSFLNAGLSTRSIGTMRSDDLGRGRLIAVLQ